MSKHVLKRAHKDAGALRLIMTLIRTLALIRMLIKNSASALLVALAPFEWRSRMHDFLVKKIGKCSEG